MKVSGKIISRFYRSAVSMKTVRAFCLEVTLITLILPCCAPMAEANRLRDFFESMEEGPGESTLDEPTQGASREGAPRQGAPVFRTSSDSEETDSKAAINANTESESTSKLRFQTESESKSATKSESKFSMRFGRKSDT
ncbi:MAG: hypothetical protein Q4C70_06980, partial [Planctomycetia bacterium]|nr:hypothetical protein [Planctomycetia bacterium]